MIRPILKKGDPRLLIPSQEITDFEMARNLVTDMWDTLISIQGLYRFTRGSGLAAIQLGQPWRANVIEFNGQRYTLINPRIVAHSDEQAPIREGCLSFFDLRGKAYRWLDVTVEALDLDTKPFSVSSGGNADFSSLLIHELRHNDGKLYDSDLAPGEQLYEVPDMPKIP